MESNGRVPPPHHHHPLPGPGVWHPDAFASAVHPPVALHPPVGGVPRFEMLPPHGVMEQKLSAQHIEINKLATENQRLAVSHGTLRQDLATAKHELQLLHAHISDANSDKEQQIRGITDKMSMMESELKPAESIKKELLQARTEAQSLVSGRQELISKVQQLNCELQMAHFEAQQIPSLMAKLDSLRQEYQHCRGTYDNEKKLYNDHLESLQVMENNYMAMSSEVEKHRAELRNATNYDHRTGGQHVGSTGYSGNVSLVNYASGQAYGVQPGHGSHLGGGSAFGPAVPAGAEGNSHVIAQPAPYGTGAARDASSGTFYSAFRGTRYDPHRGHVGAPYDAQKGHSGAGYEGQRVQSGTIYDAQRGVTGPGYDPQRVPGFEVQRTLGDDVQRGANYNVHKGVTYDASSRGTAGPYPPMPSSRAATGYESAARGVNPVHR